MRFLPGSKVLFVGEGDFSFVASLCQETWCSQVSLTATCLQEKLTERAVANTNILKEKDVEVILGVDATQLNGHPELRDRRFSHIVFNFPHVGGKMKIHLNRLLLREFFKSATHILGQGGQVLVSLCAGQGGVPIDTKFRRWDDSWQVVLMASYSDLVLTKVEAFNTSCHSGYLATGYRSMEKGFVQEGSLIYTFQISLYQWKVSQHLPDGTKHIFCDGQYIKVPSYVADKIEKDYFTDTKTVIGCISQLIIESISNLSISRGKIRPIFEKMNYKILSDCIGKFKNTDMNCDMELLYSYRLKRSEYVQVEPLLIFISYKKKIDLDELFIDLTFNVHNMNKSFILLTKRFVWREVLETIMPPIESTNDGDLIIQDNFVKSLFVINISLVAQAYFGISLNELFAEGQHIQVDKDVIVYSPSSLCPIEYTYDLSFWETRENPADEFGCTQNEFDQNKAEIIINNIAQESLVSCILLSSYSDPVSLRKSYTYRMKYRSFDYAMSDTLAKAIHENIGKTLEDVMGVEVR